MRRIIYVLLALLLVLICVFSLFSLLENKTINEQNDLPLIIQTTHGPVEGIEYTSFLKQKCYKFIGIPYAAPPITGIDPYTGEKVDRRFKVIKSHQINCDEKIISLGET